MSQRDSADLLALIESSDDLIWSVDRAYKLVTFNRAFKAYFSESYDVTVAEGMSPEQILPPELAKLWPSLYERALREGTYQIELARRDGKCIDITLNPILTEGKRTGVAVFGRERSTHEEKIQEPTKTPEIPIKISAHEIFEKNGSVMLFVDPESASIIAANQAAADYYGYPKQRLMEMTLDQIDCSSLEEKTPLDSSPCVSRCHRLSSGEARDVLIYSSPMMVEEKNLLFCVIHDVTERNHALMAVKTSEARYHTIFQTSLDAVVITRLEDGRIIDVNQAFVTDSGYEREKVIGRTTLELPGWLDPRDRQHCVQILHQYAVVHDLEIQFKRKNGQTYWGLISASVIALEGVPCIVTVIRNITDSKVAEDAIRNLSYYDQLTGLPNRRLFFDRLRQSMLMYLPKRNNHAVILIDIDNFKTFNDTLGHQIGDMMLQEIARRLTACIPHEATLARLGGDEFIVSMAGLNEDSCEAAADAQLIAEKIIESLSQPYNLSGREIYTTASIGITVFSGQREAANEVLQQADIAMHLAKSAGRNVYQFFVPGLQVAVNARASLEQDLREAIKKNQFELYYQPQLDGNQLIGAEALIRWLHPRRGLLSPVEFIALAEETGLIIPMGEWVLKSACQQIAAWANEVNTASITLAVNVSARQLCQPNFVEFVRSVIETSGAKPQNLKLELTESMLVDNFEDVIQKMSELKTYGVGFSLDDFGTGYSSLSYLKRLPLAELKIDRSFVRDILVDVSSCAIAQAVISLSQVMGLSVIAEGVETEEQRLFLAHLGCHAYQGFLYSRPIRLEHFQGLLRVGVPVS